jgi:hypothetical protein
MTPSEYAREHKLPFCAAVIQMTREIKSGGVPRSKKSVPAGSGLTQKRLKQLVKDLGQYEGKFRAFCRMHGISQATFALALADKHTGFWEEYAAKNNLSLIECSYCRNFFFPVTVKQLTCSTRCTSMAKQDDSYFGGMRRFTLGMADGICQLCGAEKKKGLSSHHVIGKKNDPENECLVALCVGCHDLITKLSLRKFLATSEGWERLIVMTMTRRLAEVQEKNLAVDATVALSHYVASMLGEEKLAEK